MVNTEDAAMYAHYLVSYAVEKVEQSRKQLFADVVELKKTIPEAHLDKNKTVADLQNHWQKTSNASLQYLNHYIEQNHLKPEAPLWMLSQEINNTHIGDDMGIIACRIKPQQFTLSKDSPLLAKNDGEKKRQVLEVYSESSIGIAQKK